MEWIVLEIIGALIYGFIIVDMVRRGEKETKKSLAELGGVR